MKRKVDDEAAWITVARQSLPGHLTWPGFCRTMSWPGSVPAQSRCSDNMKLGTYLSAARALGLDPVVFLERVVCEMDSRNPNPGEPNGQDPA